MRRNCLFLCLLPMIAVSPVFGFFPPEPSAELAAKEIAVPGLEPDSAHLKLSELTPEQAASRGRLLQVLGATRDSARFDARGGRPVALWLREPILPGAGNALDWQQLGYSAAPDEVALEQLAWERVRTFVDRHATDLAIDLDELTPNVGIHSQGQLIQIHAARVVDGIAVRGAGLAATINSGNLVLMGFDRWGDLEVARQPTLDEAQAFDALLGYLGPRQPDDLRAPASLELLPLAAEEGDYEHRLVWVFPLRFDGVIGRYDGAVDAHTGEIVELRDTLHYQNPRNVKGGVYPFSNDGIPPNGNEVAGYPMPFANVTHDGGTATADAGGNVFGVTGTMTTDLSGPFIRIDDFCGEISESSADGDLDLGTSDGTDCTTPPGASPGNTHASRTCFYELNRISEQGRGHLPTNTWLQNQLTAEVNISVVCNAFWTGSVVQFFRSQGDCANLGEIAGVIDHEWGHGMDDFGTNGSVSNPGEGIADVFAALRLNDSCPGRGALANTCGGFGDPCIPAFGCTSARDIDWMRRQSQQPHDVAWVNANCGNSRHCRGALTSESIWDLLKRDLPGRYGFDNNTALEVATRLTFLGTDNVASWFSLSNGEEGGCAASSGYQQFLASDDDNGDLNDGTPHMQAIFDAFDRHGIACDTPAVQSGGCAGRPTVAPAVTAISAAQGAGLTWSAVPGATRYKVFRTDGERQCDFGKTIAGETTDTSFDDTGLQDGREYYYVVAGFLDSDACMGPTSACTAVTSGDTGTIFSDAFESGDASRWSSRVGR
ncbi:MAG: hypothetical protein AAF560_32330 [Acidobacteriota bacterium]